MRAFFVFAFAVLLGGTASAATLKVEVTRQGFTGPIQVAVAPRVEGDPPQWSATKTLAPGQSVVRFDRLAAGLYVVLASGPEPLQRLSAKANLGTKDSTLHLVIPKSTTVLRATLAGEPIANAAIALRHGELRWRTELRAGEDGRFAGPLWEPALYTASVTRVPTSAPHSVDVWLSPAGSTIDVPDRHVRGRILAAGGAPLAGAIVDLRSETSQWTRTTRTSTGADGRFEYFGVPEGPLTLTARAPSYLLSDTVRFELRGRSAQHSVDLELTRGEPRAVRVVDARGLPIADAMLITSCGGHMKSTTVTNAEGSADVALPGAASCEIYVLPKEGSIAAGRFEGAERLVIRVPDGTSSLRMVLKSEAGEAFSNLGLLLRINGMVVPPAIARMLGSRGFLLTTNDEGSISLERIPPGTYEFWPYHTSDEAQMLYEIASEFAAPISVKVLTGENNATIRFQAR
ncbi:MAG TPA: carboxypeptidase regulatory-like domain-containing protein [Thermoanaerobaculia bacterium]|nr:carboxypeptidase regulatory-like domain-containing protein [Thermoanaerobaculia bacterium]